MLRQDHHFSYLSNTPRTVFFRELAFVYPELLDAMCSADNRSIHQVQQALRFICNCIEATNNLPSDHQPLYTAVHEWLVGPVIQLLTFEDDDDHRKVLSELLRRLCPKSHSFRGTSLPLTAFVRRSISGMSAPSDMPQAADAGPDAIMSDEGDSSSRSPSSTLVRV